MFRLGTTELIVLLAVFLVIFGPTKLPEAGRAIGKSISEFRKATHKNDNQTSDDTKEKGAGEK